MLTRQQAKWSVEETRVVSVRCEVVEVVVLVVVVVVLVLVVLEALPGAGADQDHVHGCNDSLANCISVQASAKCIMQASAVHKCNALQLRVVKCP